MRKPPVFGIALAIAVSGIVLWNEWDEWTRRAQAQEAREEVARAIPALHERSYVVSGGVIWATTSGNIMTNGATTSAYASQCDDRANCIAVPANNITTIGTTISVAPPRPVMSVSCADDACVVHGLGSMDDAKGLLEKIANRSMRVEVAVHDAACNVQRETIQPKPKEDLVAEAR
jgi:hypothetical protein